MGKDGTQLLRHCVRLLLVVGKDLSSVRQSGKKTTELCCFHCYGIFERKIIILVLI